MPDTPIRVIEQTKDYVVFDKPHGITVHPNELSFFNTALEILRRDHDIPTYMHGMFTCHHAFAQVVDAAFQTVNQRHSFLNIIKQPSTVWTQ